MELDRLIAFIGVAVIVVVVPGPDMALVARNVVRHGRSAGYATSFGVCTGILCWALAAAFGVSALLATSATAFAVLKVAGALYLIYLGITALRSPLVLAPVGTDGTKERPAEVPWRTSWAQGLLSALLNPKLGVFFLTLLPQFVHPEAGALAALQLAFVFDAIGLAWLLAYSAMLGALRDLLARPAPQRALRYVTGAVLMGLGARLAVERS